MSQRLKNLYAYLIQNRKHQHLGWYEEYKKFTEDVDKIRVNIEKYDLNAKEAYEGTSFQKSDDPFNDFIYQLLYKQSNGISSRGQSVLSQENLNKMKRASDFVAVLKKIITSNDLQSYRDFQEWWCLQGVGNNPVLINRAVGACCKELSSTVDEGKFNQIFSWLEREQLIPLYPAGSPQDWFSKNVYLIEKVTFALDHVEDTDRYWISIFIWEMYLNMSNPFSLKKQIVKYGSPGTGKTYTAKQQAELLFQKWKGEFADNVTDFNFYKHIETVQFHPSYTYEDFLEGLRPKLDENNQAQLTLQNGIFKEFCKNAGKWECGIAKLSLTVPNLNKFDLLTIGEIKEFKDELTGEHWQYIFNIADQSKRLVDIIPPYFFIIDEINRAELSRVFGELMYCLEYRGVEGAIKTQYANLNDADTGMIKIGGGYQFFIPKNLFIIGTMNTIDRSVDTFDFALRRRFRWEEVAPDTSLLHYHLSKYNSKWVLLADILEKLNVEIKKEPLLGRDFQIGHAYLWNLEYSKELNLKEVRNAVWEDSIGPLLQEYLRGTGQEDLLKKFASIFNSEQ